MARVNVQSERVQTLLSARLIPLLLAHGNIAALVKALNDALNRAGFDGALHPNRLHTLLSDDVSRAVNDGTLELIERAAGLAVADDSTLDQRAAAALQVLREQASRLHVFGGAGSEELASRLGVPPAVAALLLPDAPQPSAERAATVADVQSGSTAESPDWSYQDTAVARCLEAFARRPNARVGLVLPTGAGKTRTALRIVLTKLDRHENPKALVYWVTHRKNLREQAHRELQKIVGDGKAEVPVDRLVPLANRIRFVMVGDLARTLQASGIPPALIVVDEAHHAAAPSYQAVFDSPATVPVLLLTATPNRTDALPIGIDEIAFTITYRELAERRAVLIPQFRDFPVNDFDWSPEAIADLADELLDSASAEFTKVLVLAPRVARVEEFYAALVQRLPQDHPLELEDLGYVHGGGNSLGVDNEDFLARFVTKPRAILISAELLLEGFDDPAVNTVVLTYPSTSVIKLMQAAGRCVRYSPGKRAAYLVQARNSDLAYHFDQRWLYQEIDDFLRPQLQDIEYGTAGDLQEKTAALLRAHNVDVATSKRVLTRLEMIVPGETCRLFLYGRPYFGPIEAFDAEGQWGAILEAPETSLMLRSVFNRFCALGADLSDPSDFLLRDGAVHGVTKDLASGSRWREIVGLLTASYFAKREVHGPTALEVAGSRPFRHAGATTWLKYVTFAFRPALPPALSAFLRDCHNVAAVEARYLDAPKSWAAAVKVPLPLGGSEAFLLGDLALAELEQATHVLRSRLADAEPRDQFSVLGGYIAGAEHVRLPVRLTLRFEFLLTPSAKAERLLMLSA